ncbi:carboxylesterase/lipase family protein [Mycobacterium sp. OAE908]
MWENEVAVFRGIPYAEPPFGPLRFKAPVPAAWWDGVRDVAEFGPPVPQASHTDSDDCLTLNIWSPELAAAGLPVMVWIHGGTYLEGTSGNPHHDGTILAGSGVVMVSMNYRTGFEGFAHIAGAPDNRGLLDQIAALRWVQENIEVFGGDPGNVTVFGQSAGGGCIAALLAMPMAAGLFRRAIPQSMPGTYFSPRLAAAISAAIAAQVDVGATVEDLARISPRGLIDATAEIRARMPQGFDVWGPMALTPTPFSPVVDGDVLPSAPWRALAGGAARDIDLLVGHTRDEYRLFASGLGHLPPFPHDAHAYRAAYPAADPAQLREIINSDWLFRMPSLHLADAAHAGGGDVWTYELCWGFNRDEDASHSLDFLLLFGTLTADVVRNHPAAYPNAADEASRISRQMRSDWVTFAATGQPGWARYHPDTRLTRVYTAEPTTQPYPEERSRRIWATHRFGTLDLQT